MLLRPFTNTKKTSVLSFVFQQIPEQQIDQAQLTEMVKQSYSQGINTFGVDFRQDKAAAEKLLGEALKALEVPR